MKYFRIFSKKEFLFKYEIVQYSLLLLYRYYHYKDGTSRSVQSFQRASKGVQQCPDHLPNSLIKGENFIQVNLFLENWRNSLIFHSINAKLVNFSTYKNMKKIFMRKSMKIRKISISSKTKKSFIFDGIIMK